MRRYLGKAKWSKRSRFYKFTIVSIDRHLDWNERVVDRDNIHPGLDGGPQDESADVVEAVDADLGRKELGRRRRDPRHCRNDLGLKFKESQKLRSIPKSRF